MSMKTWMNICKGVAIVQAIVAPGLMMYGHVTNNKKIRNIGAVWCGLVCLDTARTVTNAIDILRDKEELEKTIDIMNENNNKIEA